MTYRPPTPKHSSIDRREASLAESIASLQGCCDRAREAARAGRGSAAHDLFQNALVFFDRARGVTWDDEDEIYLWQHAWQLSRARRELDECADVVYCEPAELELAGEISQSVAPFDEAYCIELSRFLGTIDSPALEVETLRLLRR